MYTYFVNERRIERMKSFRIKNIKSFKDSGKIEIKPILISVHTRRPVFYPIIHFADNAFVFPRSKRSIAKVCAHALRSCDIHCPSAGDPAHKRVRLCFVNDVLKSYFHVYTL